MLNQMAFLSHLISAFLVIALYVAWRRFRFRIRALQEEWDRFYALSAGLLGTITYSGRFERFNPEWACTLGYTPPELRDLSLFELVHPDDRRPVAELLIRLEDNQSSTEFECRFRCKDGAYKWFVWSASPFAARSVIYLVGQDITEQKRSELERADLLHWEQATRAAAESSQTRLAFLAEASNMLASTIDYETTLINVAYLAVPHMADWCTVSVVNQEGVLEQIAVAHQDPALAEWAASQQHRLDPTTSMSWAAMNAGKPLLFAEMDPALPERVASTPEHLAFLRKLDLHSTMIVPMLLRNRAVGVLSFHYAESGRRYSAADLSLAEELAMRAALAVENARLYRQAQESATRAEETLALLDTLLSCAPVGIAFLDPSLRYVRVNEALAAHNGIAVNQHVGRTVGEVIPELATVLEPLFRRVMRTGDPVVAWEGSSVYGAQGLNGRHWLSSIYPVRTGEGEGKVLGVGIMVTDISERKRMEEALRESELLLSGQKHVLEMIATSRPLAEIQQTILSFVEQQTRYWECRICLADAAGVLHVKNEAGRAPCWTTPILTTNGKALGVMAMFARTEREPRSQDRTLVEVFAHLAGIAIDRQNAEEARNRKLDSLIDHSAEGVIAVDEDERLLVVNGAARRLLDVPAFSGTPVLGSAGLPKALVEILRQAALPECRRPARHTLIHGTAELDVHVSPVVAGVGRHFGTIALLQDVTAIAKLRRLQESFVANVSHELRAPLASLLAMAEAINDRVASAEAQARYIKAILSETRRLRRLTNDLLELSRLDSGVAEITREEFDLDLVLETTEETWELRCKAAGVQLAVDRQGYRVLADYDRVLQVLTNLLDNAVKFSPRGGTVRVWAEPADGLIRVNVSDTGQGIATEHLPYVWQRFYMVDKARTRAPGSGTGLGLAIAHHLVENMGGQVGAESEQGKGSVFWFTLPMA